MDFGRRRWWHMGLGLRRRWSQIEPWLLPERWAAELWHRSAARHPRPAQGTASDLRSIPLGALRIDVYWSDVPGVGRGPSASVFAHDAEVMRLDCFGGSNGHMHLNPFQAERIAGRVQTTPRIYFPAGSHRDHIERARFELRRNLPAAIRTNLLPWVQRTPLDPDALAAAADRTAASMRELLDAHGGPAAEEVASGG